MLTSLGGGPFACWMGLHHQVVINTRIARFERPRSYLADVSSLEATLALASRIHAHTVCLWTTPRYSHVSFQSFSAHAPFRAVWQYDA